MREDHDLAFLLQYENIAWYRGGTVRILDRRVYPAAERFVVCRSFNEVAQAIRDMVTQSYGPFHAAAMGMALAAHTCRRRPAQAQRDYLRAAANAIATARPTTERKMRLWTDDAERVALAALNAGESACEAIVDQSVQKFDDRYRKIARIGAVLADQVPAGGAIMTQCYADADLGMLLRTLRERRNNARFFTPETRPYLQGARLTASVIRDMGFDVTLITDNMPAWTLKTKSVDLFTTAADVICMDGHIVNKVGTFQIALAADYLGVPYVASGIPDRTHPDEKSVRIEERDPDEVLHAMGRRTCKQGVHGFYPAFDITPPQLVKGVATDQGLLPAKELSRYRFY